MKVAIVTPTIGSEDFAKCLSSVQNQTYENLTHYVFLDGKEHYDKIHPLLDDAADKRSIQTVSLDDNVGKGWYGHRVYAACSFLVNADVIMYLDEDNWMESDHVASLVDILAKKNLSWAYSLRKIHDKLGNFICEDNSESLGKWPVWFDNNVHHIDTSCYAVKRDVALQIGHAWYGQWGADRQFFFNLSKHFPNYDCTKKHSLCYRLDGNPKSVQKEFFYEGNEKMMSRYNNNLPWAS